MRDGTETLAGHGREFGALPRGPVVREQRQRHRDHQQHRIGAGLAIARNESANGWSGRAPSSPSDPAGNADQQRHLEGFERADEGQQQYGQDGWPRQAERHASPASASQRAPDMAAASSSAGSIAESGGSVSRNAIGVHSSPSTKIMPPRLNNSIGVPAIPSHSRSHVVDQAVVGPEQQNPADALHDQRRRQRQECADEHGLAERNIGARHQPGRRKPSRTARSDDRARTTMVTPHRSHPAISSTRGVIVQAERGLGARSAARSRWSDQIEERRQDHRRARRSAGTTSRRPRHRHGKVHGGARPTARLARIASRSTWQNGVSRWSRWP